MRVTAHIHNLKHCTDRIVPPLNSIIYQYSASHIPIHSFPSVHYVIQYHAKAWKHRPFKRYLNLVCVPNGTLLPIQWISFDQGPQGSGPKNNAPHREQAAIWDTNAIKASPARQVLYERVLFPLPSIYQACHVPNAERSLFQTLQTHNREITKTGQFDL